MNKKILVLGDSHALVFNSKFVKLLFGKGRFTVVSVNGATVSGLENPNSKTNASQIFFNAFTANPDAQTVIFLLGEVDTGFVIWYRAQKYNANVDDMLEMALKNYNLLLTNPDLKNKQVIVISSPLPTIYDDNNWGEISNLRKEVKADLKQRTGLALKFNSRMKKIVEDNNQIFIDLDSLSLSNTGAGAKKILRNLNKSDHHYNKLIYALMLKMKLRKHLK